MDASIVTINQVIEVRIDHEHQNDPRAKYCKTCGQAITTNDIVTVYACSACRNKVNPLDTYCSFCGARLISTGKIENYATGKLDDDIFTGIKQNILLKKQKLGGL